MATAFLHSNVLFKEQSTNSVKEWKNHTVCTPWLCICWSVYRCIRL